MMQTWTRTVLSEGSMLGTNDQFGKLNPRAASDLARFSFLIGAWRFDASVKLSDEQTMMFQGTWAGRYILDGFAIADEYRMTDESGEVLVLGLNLRSYDASQQIWNIKWLNALTGAWTDLSPSELGGVNYGDGSISYAFRDLSPMDAHHTFTRVTYMSVSDTRFTWTGEKSNDGKGWTVFMVVNCHRIPPDWKI
jgi:hypothetical protein